MFHVEHGCSGSATMSANGKGVPPMSAIAKPKSRLGRGLSSLLSIWDLPVEAEVVSDMSPTTVDGDRPAEAGPPENNATGEIGLDRISPNPHQPRRKINDDAIAELAASIRSTGVIQPIIVRRSPED